MLYLPQLFVVAIVAGVLTVFFDVAYQSYLPVLVEPEHLVDANGKLGASQAFGQVAGPSFGGVLVGAFGAGYAVVIDALSFLVSAVTTIGIRKHEPAPDARHPDVRLRDEIKEGLAFVFHHPILRKVVGCTSTSNFFSAATFAVITIFLVRTLDSPTWVIGVVFSVGQPRRPHRRVAGGAHRQGGRHRSHHLAEPGGGRSLRPPRRDRLPTAGA